MKHFTQTIWRKALSTLVLFVASVAAFAADFEPAPTTFNTADLNGTYDVKFVGCEKDGLWVDLVNLTDYVLVDATGTKVPYSFVAPEMKDDYTVSLTVANVENAPAGTYTIKVPAQAFCLTWMPNITSDAFDVTLNLTNGSEPVDPGTGEVEPGLEEGTVTFTLDDHKSDTSIYFHDGDIVESNGAGIMLKFNRVALDGEKYTTCYKSNGGFVQFKDCQFTISAPAGNNIEKIVFEDGAPLSTTYDLDNLEASGYYEGVWTGSAQSITFNTKVIESPIYDYDDEDNEYITGYTTYVTGARVAKIYVTLERIPDGIESIGNEASKTVVFDIMGRRNSNASLRIEGGKKVMR